MKKTIMTSALCLSLLATGCVTSQKAPASSSQATSAATTAAATTEAPAESATQDTQAETSEAAKTSHKATVEVITKMTIKDDTYVVPKLTVDGKEATEINDALAKYIDENYALKKNGEYSDGYSTRLAWGANDNMVSIVLMASATSEDYFTHEVFNYDLDTLKSLDAKEVTKRLGMTEDEFLSKTSDLVKKYSKELHYDEEKSLALVTYDKITPFILPDGKPGVLACFVHGKDSQFEGMTARICLDLNKMERADLK
jgi:uncharacterized protein (DUF4415 family)